VVHVQDVRREDDWSKEEDADMGRVRTEGNDGVEALPDPVYSTATENEVMTRALGGYDPHRRVPTLVELLRPSVRCVLKPYAVNLWGWKNFYSKLEKP
jgi:hypothetical protein